MTGPATGPTRNSAGRFVLNATSSVATTIIRMTVLVWVSQYLLRRIEPAEYALVPVVSSLMVVAELFPLIFLRGLSRFMVEADARGDGAGLAGIVSSMLPVLGGVAAVLLACGLFAAGRIDSFIVVDPLYRDDAQLMLMLLMVSLCVEVATTPLRVGLYVRMRFVEQNLIQLFTELLRVGILLGLLFGVSTRALWVVVATTSGNLANILILMVYTYHILPDARFRAGLISGATMRRLLGFSLWTLVQSFNNLVLRAAPALLLNRHGTAIDVTSYHVGNLADVQIRKLVTSAVAPATPALTTIFATEGESALQKFYYLGGRYYLWVTLFLLPPLLAFAYPLIELYVGERYRAAATVMILVLGAYPFTWASAMFYQIAYAVGRIRAFNLCSILLGVIPLAGMWYFVVLRDMGATGAAIGMGGGYALVHLAVMWPFGLWLVQGSWSVFLRRTLVPGLAPFAAALLACLAFGQLVGVGSWTGFLAGCGLSVVVYCATLFGLCLDAGDRDLMRRAWRKIGTRLRGKRG